MLCDELQTLNSMATPAYAMEFGGDELEKECGRIKAAWSLAAFSSAPSESLSRYFNYHLLGVSKIADSPFSLNNQIFQNALLSLTTHLFDYYAIFMDLNKEAYRSFVLNFTENTTLERHDLICNIRSVSLPPELVHILINYLEAFDLGGASFTFEVLLYFYYFVPKLNKIFQGKPSAYDIEEALIGAGFNHLAFFSYLQKNVRARFEIDEVLPSLFAAKERWLSYPDASVPLFQAEWPSLKAMMNGWIDQEITLHQKEFVKILRTKKISLNLSVAQLACFIKMFEEGPLENANRAGVFRFCAAHFQSKRQAVISQGSLSKEFYSINQVTAANVRGMLKQMLSRIDKQFFPAWLVINAVIAYY